MFEKLHSAGYDLSEVEIDQWVFSIRGSSVYVGTFAKVVKLMVLEFGFSLNDIERAAHEMISNGHNTAHFGIYKTMINTFNRENNHRRAS